MTNLEIICLESEAFFELVEQVVDRLKVPATKEKWISDKAAMSLLGIKSKTTLQKMRDDCSIVFTQPMKKLILYDRESIIKYLEKHSTRSLFKE